MEYNNNTLNRCGYQMVCYCIHTWINRMFISQSNSHKLFSFSKQIPIIQTISKRYLIRIIIIFRNHQYFQS